MSKLKFLVITLSLLSLCMVGCEREITGDVVSEEGGASEDCFGCHTGYLDQAQGEWANSIHASGSNVDYTNRGGSDCTKCHNQQGFLAFQATGELPDIEFSEVSAIGCFTCHAPHETGDMTPQYTTSVTLANGDIFDHGDGNLCVQCHQSRKSGLDIADGQSTNRYWGPHHGPQGDLLNASNGYEFPGLSYTFTSSPHANQVEGACAGCHMGNPARVHEGYSIGGHSFNMVNVESGDQLGRVCGAGSTCHDGVSDINFVTADSLDYDHDGVVEGRMDEIDGLADSLSVLLIAEGVLDGTAHATSGTIADGHLAGALWNFLMVHEDRSHGMHNFKYVRDLLDASIDYVDGL